MNNHWAGCHRVQLRGASGDQDTEEGGGGAAAGGEGRAGADRLGVRREAVGNAEAAGGFPRRAGMDFTVEFI